tara:strand:- start:6190 stop:6543 length:354 start_codon:yes stop_codon:yes gene_type:complete
MSIEGDKLKKISNIFSKNKISKDASLINYFIKKFASENSNDLSEIYRNIPKEERGDFVDAINRESDRIGSVENNSDDAHLEEIYSQMMNVDSEKVMLELENGHSITMGDLLSTLADK